MIDTHTHADNTLCDIDLGEVKKIILAGASFESSKINIELSNKFSSIYPAIGIHPQETDLDDKFSIIKQLNLLEELVKNTYNKIIAIGECGLDLSPVPEGIKERPLETQIELFIGQIELSRKYKLPLIIHARKAVDETIEILNRYSDIKGVFHCYAGGKKRIEKVLNMNSFFYFGIDGNLTYETGLEEVVKNILKNRLVLETDSPYLTPLPFRGQINKPAYIKYIYEKVAEIWEMNFEETEKQIDNNANRLFFNESQK